MLWAEFSASDIDRKGNHLSVFLLGCQMNKGIRIHLDEGSRGIETDFLEAPYKILLGSRMINSGDVNRDRPQNELDEEKSMIKE